MQSVRHCDMALIHDYAKIRVSTLSLEEDILMVLTRDVTRTLSAPELAQAIATESDWHSLLMPIRRAAVALAQSGRLVIYRKGKPVDPLDFRGVYRVGLPRQD